MLLKPELQFKIIHEVLKSTTQDLLNQNMLVWDQGISLQPVWLILSHNQSWEPLKNVHWKYIVDSESQEEY